MKEKIFSAVLVMACCLAVTNAYAQLKVYPDGRVIIGEDPLDDQPSMLIGMRDSTTMLRVMPDEDKNAYISYGTQSLEGVYTVMTGELKRNENDNNSDQLWLHGKKGLYSTFNQNAGDTVFYFDYLRDAAVNFNYPIKSQGVLLSSDERFKENIHEVDGALDLLSGIHGVAYNYKKHHDYTFTPDMPALPGEAGDRLRRDTEQMASFYQQLEEQNSRQEHYGFLAQEVRQVLPDLVHEDKDGFLYVDYIGVIPLLVNAIQELQARLDKAEGKQNAPSAKPQNGTAMLSERTAEVLSQNDPNPFSSDTSIGVCLPEDVAQAAIYIYDLQGKQVRRLDVPDRGQTSVTLHGGDLQAGMYIYSLIADGKELASKKMILTK